MNSPLKNAVRIGALLAAAGFAGISADAATTPAAAPAQRVQVSPDQPVPRTGSYKVTKRGPKAVRAKCDEGGYVWVPTHPARVIKGSVARTQDAAIRDACKSVDYSK